MDGRERGMGGVGEDRGMEIKREGRMESGREGMERKGQGREAV